MADCKIAPNCPYYNGQATRQAPNVSSWLRYQYCHGNFSLCARHAVHEALGQEHVPADLFPSEQVRVQQILGNAYYQRGGLRKAF